MELIIGNKYRIKNRRGRVWNYSGEMDHWMGKIVTIKRVSGSVVTIYEDRYENGGCGWAWNKNDFESLSDEFVNDYVPKPETDIRRLLKDEY